MRLVTALAVLCLGVTACDAAPPEGTIVSEKESFVIETVTDHLDHPWSLAFLSDDEYLVTERSGKLWRVNDRGEKKEITGVPIVSAEGQGGLLDVALSPDFKTTRRVYLSYAEADEKDQRNTAVAYGTLNANRLDNVKVIFRATPKTDGGNHYGGRLLFSDDGYLYVTLGERFDYRDQAQNTTDNIGTLVRIHPDGTLPKDNPYGLGIYTYGHRNVQGIAQNPQTKEIWAHEHGPRGGDELNILKKGANYGWPLVSAGNHYWGTSIPKTSDNPALLPPLHSWTPSIAPSGMTFYTGDAFKNWQGNVFVGALAGEHLRRLEITDGKVSHEEILLKDMARIRDVRTGPDGALYLLTDDAKGRLIRLKSVH